MHPTAFHIAGTTTTSAMIAAAREMLDGSPHVRLHPERLDAFVPLAAATRPCSFEWYLSDKAKQECMFTAFLEFAFNSALNGGYFAVDEATNTIRQWEKKGSGSQALLEWIQELDAAQLVPGRHLVDTTDERVLDAFRKRFAGQPHAEKRIEIAAQFIQSSHIDDLFNILEDARSGHGSGWCFDLAAVDRLVNLFPLGFGDDPFRKKAILTFMEIAAYLQVRNECVIYDLPIPSDYQIPRILAWKGAIEVSDAFADELKRTDRLIDVTSEAVTHFRAAAIVSARQIARMADVPDYIVDNALFMTFRKDADFIANALPPMRCDSMWF